MSNEAKMTLEEKITQRIKDDTLMAVVGDEDAITDLVKRALDEALFQPIRIRKEYGGYDEYDSPVVAAARDAAKEVCGNITEHLTKHLLDNEEVRKAIIDHVVASLPNIIGEIMAGTLRSHAEITKNNLREKLMQVGVMVPY